ncbi:MAG: kazal domain protein [Adhaeribacter sp.]|nr:kazal domain protein [Adhaeribacter sp.]
MVRKHGNYGALKNYFYGLAGLLLVTCKPTQLTCIDTAKINPEALCTMQYEPVCGCNNKTYGNACQAENAGVTAFTKGACPE